MRCRLFGLLMLLACSALAGGALAEDGLEASSPAASAVQATPPQPRRFTLSFDDGPLPGKSDKVLAALAQLKTTDGQPVKAAFFMLADAPQSFCSRRQHYAPYEIWTEKGSMRRYPELVEQVRQAGHLIGNHSTHHAWFRWPWLQNEEAVEAEISQWEQIAGQADTPKLFRPPYLINTPAVQTAAGKLGYHTILGHTVGDASPFAGKDSLQQNILHILATAAAEEDPVVLIFHDIMPATYDNLYEIVDFLQKNGHQLVSFTAP